MYYKTKSNQVLVLWKRWIDVINILEQPAPNILNVRNTKLIFQEPSCQLRVITVTAHYQYLTAFMQGWNAIL